MLKNTAVYRDISMLTLLLMISFASVNAVIYTPALPEISDFFKISANTAQLTVIWYLIAYAGGQLFYGPLANRFGRKPALYMGIVLAMLSSLICVVSYHLNSFHLLLLGRALLGLGSGVGLKVAFTLTNEVYPAEVAAKKISYLILAFAITPALGIATGGILTTHFGWASCFYASFAYATLLFILCTRLPETLEKPEVNALKLNRIFSDYKESFTSKRLIAGGLLMGALTCFVYLFAALVPFIAIDQLGLSSDEYGFANLIPPVGMILGSLTTLQLLKIFSMQEIIKIGISINMFGILLMALAIYMAFPVVLAIFVPMIIVYLGAAMVMPNASTLAMQSVTDKSHGSAVMNFINMGITTLLVLSAGYWHITPMLLPMAYAFIAIAMIIIFKAGRLDTAT